MSESKGYAEDLSEGKFSLPIIHTIQQSKTKYNLILDVLRARTQDHAVKAQAIGYMRTATGSLAYTAEVIHRLAAQIQAMLEELRGDEVIGGIIQKIMVDDVD